MKDLSTLLKYLSRYKGKIFAGSLFLLAANSFLAFHPWILGRIIDAIGWKIGMEFVNPLILGFMAVVLLEGVSRFFMRRVLIGISRHIENDLRNDFYKKTLTLSASVFNRIRTGEIMSRATNDLANVRMVLGPGIMYTLNTISTLIFVIVVLLSVNFTLTWMALLPLPFLSIVILIVSRLMHVRFTKVQEKLADLTTVVQENISGIRVVKGHCREQGEIENFQGKSEELRAGNLSVARIFAAFLPFMMMISGISAVVILYFGGQMVSSGEISLGDLVSFFAYLMILVWPMSSLGWVTNLFLRGAVSMKRINEIMDIVPDIKDEEQAGEISGLDYSLSLENVSFSYDDKGPEVLKDISLKINKGETIAIVGPTGSGKSSLLKLLMRVYDPSSGKISLDGKEIKSIKLNSLRRQVGYVPQETFLFSESVADNIAIGAHGDEVTREQIEHAANVSLLSQDVSSFSDGYDTLLGERGINMSGGQKQRTAIARALVGSTPVLLLDDCLSAVDTNTEQKILNGLKAEMADRTALIVSHRLSSIMDSDRIIVIDEGRILEEGSHDELVNKDGLYANMWKKQQLTQELGVEEI
jgi:ATP-binding cassette subfamily B multidrug efflux pump